MAVLVLLAVAAICPLLAWVAYLLFCWSLVKRTNSSSSLKDAAVAARAFRAAGLMSVAQVVARAIGRARQ
jgi:hypothetical protein